ncbi:MAG: prepilin-type N-terminal cleavage/methylation domain-containing protein [Candidatus Omnitrophica bacterium]|nr:prepilin-type N-terminal cleavage/methylation domain-containing protein [Candidatus Omnitrophota bacterium]
MTQRLNQRGGFTLLELLMVVIIIGILAALALPGYLRAVERSRAAEMVTILGQLRGSIQRFCVQSDGVAPTSFTQLDVDDPTLNAALTSRWNLTALSGYVINCATVPITVQVTPAATRGGTGPCAGSGVNLDSALPDPITMTWLGPCA